MKTLAEFKRELTVGSKGHGWNHLFSMNLGTRIVAKVSSYEVCFENRDGKLSHLEFPKASQMKFLQDGIFEIYRNDGELILSYRKAKN